MIDYKIYCPSYKRAQTAISHKLFHPKSFFYVVRQSEALEYYKLGAAYIVIPDGAVNSLTETRNWILENKQSEYVLMVDDDMKSIERTLFRERLKCTPDGIAELIENGYQMALDAKCGLWGINNLPDPRAYSINIPFYFSCIVNGPFLAYVDTTLRHDNRMPTKDDYDMTLQMLLKHRRVLRMNHYFFVVNHLTLAGGCEDDRKRIAESEQNALLKAKWGDVLKENKWAKDSINLILRTGL